MQQVKQRFDAGALACLCIAKAQASARNAYHRARGLARIGGKALVAMGLGSAASMSYAVGPDLTTLTTAVDFSTVTTAILGVAAAMIVVYIAWKGAKMVIAAVRGG